MLWLCVHIILYALVTRWAIWWWRWKKAVYMTPGQCPAFLLSPARSLRPNVFRFICLLLAENVRKTPDSEREQKQHTQWMCAGNGYWAAVIPTTATTTHTKSEREREKRRMRHLSAITAEECWKLNVKICHSESDWENCACLVGVAWKNSVCQPTS